MVLDIGGGTADIAVLSGGVIVSALNKLMVKRQKTARVQKAL
jgi:actin-like ATPase involved in cell morphogenesis